MILKIGKTIYQIVLPTYLPTSLHTYCYGCSLLSSQFQ